MIALIGCKTEYDVPFPVTEDQLLDFAYRLEQTSGVEVRGAQEDELAERGDNAESGQ